MRDLTAVFTAIDDANAQDPNLSEHGPLAQVQGQLGSRWLAKLTDSPSAEVQIAVRAHHLKRWELARSDYPADRAGYLRWRRENKARQADAAAAILEQHDWPTTAIDRVRELLSRRRLRTDPDTQLLEDAACLVFLETQFDAISERTERDHMVAIVARTLHKMSADAIQLAGSIALGSAAQDVLERAIEHAGELANNDEAHAGA